MSKLVELGAVSAETRQTFVNGTILDGKKQFVPSLGIWVYMKADFVPSAPPSPAPVG